MKPTKMDCSTIYTNLDSLRPLSPDLFADEVFNSVNTGQLSRSEKAGKFLEHLDGLHQEDSQPFDWYSNEKSVDISIFENVSSSTPLKIENTNNAAMKHSTLNYASPVESDNLIKLKQDDYNERQSRPVDKNESLCNNVQSSTLTTLTDMDDSFYNNYLVTFSDEPIDNDLNEMEIASSPFETCTAHSKNDIDSSWLKTEALTPPESPKDEDILKMIGEIEPDALEQLVLNNSVDELKCVAELETCNSSEMVSEYGDATSPISINDPDWSPSSSSVNDPEWSPPSSVKPTRKVGGRTASSKRKGVSKSYTKPDIENRKLRKKEQNKSAATRYRLKKKVEYEEMRKEQKKLAEKNARLRSQFDDINREIRYLKSLMRDVYRKKGLIK